LVAQIAPVPLGSESILVWNIRGLNTASHHETVHELVSAKCPCVVCLQETKKVIISDFDITQLLGAWFNYAYLPTIQTCGGIFIVWHASTWSISSNAAHRLSVSVKLWYVVRALIGSFLYYMVPHRIRTSPSLYLRSMI
jgi:hypothetical protein